VSSPEGNTILAIDPDSAAVVASLAMETGCGIAPDMSGLLVSSGQGAIGGFAGSPAPLTTFELNFDNHLRLLTAVSAPNAWALLPPPHPMGFVFTNNLPLL
jgi:hypothetical protein